MQAYAEWWAGSPDDLGRPEVSPGLGDLAGLPPALMFFGTRDSLWPGGQAAGPPGRGGRLAAHLRRGAGADPRLPDPAVPPRGRPGLAADPGLPERGSPAMKISAVPFAALDPLTAYSLWKLRQDVFVVEQEAAYADLDGLDLAPETRHVVMEDDDGVVLGCARVLDERRRSVADRPGRAAPRPRAAEGWADAVMQTALQVCPDRDIVLDAQAPLAGWYAGFGFEVVRPGVPRGRHPAPADGAAGRVSHAGEGARRRRHRRRAAGGGDGGGRRRLAGRVHARRGRRTTRRWPPAGGAWPATPAGSAASAGPTCSGR